MPRYLESYYVKNRHELQGKLYFGPLAVYKVALLFIARRKRNMFFTLTDLTGGVVRTIPSSNFATSRKKRFQKQVLDLMFNKLTLLIRRFRINFIELISRVKTRFVVKACVRAVLSTRCKVTFVYFNMVRPFNGCRKKKPRRL